MADAGQGGDAAARVNALVRELHQLLESAEELDAESRGALRAAAEEIDETLEGNSTLDALRNRIERFEGSHPTLTEAVRRLVDQLAEMGI
jgi:predicted nuclease with TOPRIM domain